MKKHSIILLALMLALVLSFAGCSKGSTPSLGIQEKDVNELSEIVEVGQVVAFGQYEMDNNTDNGKEALEWRILEKTDTTALLVCENAIEAMAYDAEGNIAWQDSDVRAWLNGEFVKTAFTDAEMAKVMDTTIDGAADKFFIFSDAEISDKLAGNFAVSATKFAAANGAWNDDTLNCRWWVRPAATEEEPAATAYASVDGIVAVEADYDMVGVRPAFWAKLK